MNRLFLVQCQYPVRRGRFHKLKLWGPVPATARSATEAFGLLVREWSLRTPSFPFRHPGALFYVCECWGPDRPGQHPPMTPDEAPDGWVRIETGGWTFTVEVSARSFELKV